MPLYNYTDDRLTDNPIKNIIPSKSEFGNNNYVGSDASMNEITEQSSKNRTEFLELSFENELKYVHSIRLFIKNMIAENLGDDDKAEKIALAADELAENAIKYNAGADSSNVHIKLIHDVPDKSMTLTIRNHSTGENIAILEEELKKLNDGKPRDRFLKKLREIPGRTDGKSMLGLARVRYEAGCGLSAEVDGEQVTITAVFRI